MPSFDTLNLIVHVTAAAVWVGAQVLLIAAQPPATATRSALEQAFARVIWPALVVAVVTGMVALLRVDLVDTTSTYQIAVLAKLGLVTASGAAVGARLSASVPWAARAGGVLGLLFGLGALAAGVVLGLERP